MKFKFILILSLFATTKNVFAQNTFATKINEIIEEKNIEKRIELANKFNEELKIEIEKLETAEKIDLPNRISQLISSNKEVGIYTWTIAVNENMFKYYGILKTPNKTLILNNVNNGKDTICINKICKNPTKIILKNGDWYGAVYYEIIETKNKGKTTYTLLGNDLNGKISNKKIIEPMIFDKFGSPIFGEQIFKGNDNKRLILEYNKQSTMYMKYNAKVKMIIFNFLAPIDKKYTNDHRFYVPDISYDGLKNKRGMWKLVQNIEIKKEN